MAYDFKSLKEKTGDAEQWLSKEYSSIRTGQATPAVLDGVFVESYGSKMSIQQLASVGIEGLKVLRITPYDMEQAKGIEKAIAQSNLGLSVAIDDKGLRITFPDLTAERRASYLKIAKEKLEEARKKLRVARDEVWKDIQEREREGTIREDEKFRLKDEMQKIIDAASSKIEGHLERKEKEINA